MKPRRRYPGSPDIADTDYIVFGVSTYKTDLAALDRIVAERKAAGERKASRSSVIRELVRKASAT